MRRSAEVSLVPYHCPKCHQWLCDTLSGCLVRCEICGVWGNEKGEIIPPGEVRGYTVREFKRRQAEAEATRKPARRKQPELRGLEIFRSSQRRQTA